MSDAKHRKQDWILTLTRSSQAGRELGRYNTRDEAMLAGQAHFERETQSQDDELGWQMGHNSATALSRVGNYRVRRL
jgi:hypothetical protein